MVLLLKDALTKGHLSNKDRIIWQQVLYMPLLLPLTKGQTSLMRTELFGRRGVRIRGGVL